ncbi:ribbon-helix-helix protein, CopG family [Candidatus Saganbacteria bacterium]|nr:ribbon-helix-helix protein, CopG family [Candidatus Saganbacteria bacterium]
MLSKRIQVLLDEKEYKRLKKAGDKSHKSVGEIFREAVKLYGERLLSQSGRVKIVEQMAKLKAPVKDWAKMEKEIFKARAS